MGLGLGRAIRVGFVMVFIFCVFAHEISIDLVDWSLMRVLSSFLSSLVVRRCNGLVVGSPLPSDILFLGFYDERNNKIRKMMRIQLELCDY